MPDPRYTDEDGELAIRVIAMPENTNPNGDIFGGWVVSQMDLAGMSIAAKVAKSKVVTVAIETMSFLSPVSVGDFICCYVKLLKIGRTSLKMKITTYSVNSMGEHRKKVTEGLFTFVALDENNRPRIIDHLA